MKKLLIFILILLSFSITANAKESETDEIISSIRDELENFANSIPQNIKELLPDEIFKGDFSSLTDGRINEKTFFNIIIDYLSSNIGNIVKSFAYIICIIIISSILHTLENSFDSEALKNTFSVCSTLCIAITVFNICYSLTSQVSNYIQAVCNVMSSFAPIMAITQVMSGNLTSATVSSASNMLFISIIENFLLFALMPIIKICLCLAIVRSVAFDIDFGRLTKTVKNTFTTVIVFVMSICLFVLSYKNVLAKSADSISIKTAKFAISNFIPIVSGSVNEALNTVVSSLSLIKNSCGTVAIIIILLIVLPLIISLLLYKLCFGICTSVSSVLGCNNEKVCLEEADSICGFLLAILVCTCITFIFSLTIFIKTAVILQ